ncbi:vitamin B12 ABC transporter substrate-binding protein BtuF [Photobacterium nomapromontoriensis]|uniref:vitamin B12 ABC transporter substrate-binding protein BtuF n=1 Tax=Photobacterium nomapromontoriensis TaxID=2910237 RepID=UPI003D13AC57
MATPTPAQRIISLSPHTTELAYAAGLGNQLIAASDYSDYPEAAKSLERVANYRGIKLERIVALQPDLILAWRGGNPAREMERLEQLGFTIFYSNPLTLDDIATTIEQLGHYAASPAHANQVAADFRDRLSALRATHQQQRPVRYFYQLSSTPVMTIAGTSWPSQVFTLCGGENIFADSPAPYPQVSEEQVIVRQPEVIFGTPHGNTQTDQWQKWQQQLPAVQNDDVYILTADWLNRPTPRTIKAVEQVCHYLDTVRQK